jgi:hypothetical protein
MAYKNKAYQGTTSNVAGVPLLMSSIDQEKNDEAKKSLFGD